MSPWSPDDALLFMLEGRTLQLEQLLDARDAAGAALVGALVARLASCPPPTTCPRWTDARARVRMLLSRVEACPLDAGAVIDDLAGLEVRGVLRMREV